MKIVSGSFASETGFCVTQPLFIERDDSTEIELRIALQGKNIAALEAMKVILVNSCIE